MYLTCLNQAAVETGPQVEANRKCNDFSEIEDSKLKLTLPVDTSLPNVFLFRTTQNKAMPLDPKVSGKTYLEELKHQIGFP